MSRQAFVLIFIFQVMFEHEKSFDTENVSSTQTDQKGEVAKLQRSGNPYYKIGLPLITGGLVEDKVDPGSGLRIWSGVSSSNLCKDDVGMEVMVGEDTMSGCLVKLSRTQVCKQLPFRCLDQKVKEEQMKAETKYHCRFRSVGQFTMPSSPCKRSCWEIQTWSWEEGAMLTSPT